MAKEPGFDQADEEFKAAKDLFRQGAAKAFDKDPKYFLPDEGNPSESDTSRLYQRSFSDPILRVYKGIYGER